MQFLVLPVMLWSPFEQYRNVLRNICPKCEANGECYSLNAVGWTDGSNSNEPRLVYCINSNVLLISRIYKCPCDHRVLAHHPDILSQFRRQQLGSLVPFHLWHISGFTKSLMHYIDNLCNVGLAMQQIELLLVHNRAQLFYTLKEQFMQISLARSTQLTDHEFPDFSSQSVRQWKLSPTRHSIEACYLYHFWVRENAYNYILNESNYITKRLCMVKFGPYLQVCL